MKSTPPDPDALTPSARRILDTAATLFYERGITAVGVDLIAEESGVTKRTLYNRFGSKDMLVAAYLVDRDRRWRRHVEEAVADPQVGALDRVAAPFVALSTWSPHSPRGCAFIHALAEIPDPAHPAHRVAVEEKSWLLALFTRLAGEAGIADPAALAMPLLLLHEGALATMTAMPDAEVIDPARAAAHALISEAARAPEGEPVTS